MEFINLPDFNNLKMEGKSIERIHLFFFIRNLPRINVEFKDGTKVKHHDADRNLSINRAMYNFCKLNRLNENLLKELANEDYEVHNSCSNITIIEIPLTQLHFELEDLNSVITQNTIENKLSSVLAFLGFLYKCSPEFNGLIIIAFYADGSAKTMVWLAGFAYKHLPIKSFEEAHHKLFELMKDKPFFKSIMTLFTSAIAATDREIMLFQLWTILEPLATYGIHHLCPPNTGKACKHKIDRVLLLLGAIDYKENKSLLDEINRDRLKYIYEIRNDMVHEGRVNQKTIEKYKFLKNNSLQDNCDFMVYLIQVVTIWLIVGRVSYEDDFLKKYS